MLDTKEKPVEGKVTEPSRAWSNRYWSEGGVKFSDGAPPWPPGEVLYGNYRSREIAEQRAIDWFGSYSRTCNMQGVIYLGAIEVRK